MGLEARDLERERKREREERCSLIFVNQCALYLAIPRLLN